VSRVTGLRSQMGARDLDAALISEITNVRYLTGFTGSSGQAIVTGSANVFVTDSRYTIQAREQCVGWDVRTFASPVKGTDFLRDTVKDLGVTRLAFESDYVTHKLWQDWTRALEGVELVPSSELVDKLRAVKEPEEIQAIRRACELTDACFEYIRPKIQPNVVETDLALEIDFYFRRQGAENAFPTIAVSGERSARPHGSPGEKRIEVGDFVMLDFGAKLGGYCADITRTVVVGEASDRHRRIYDAVLKAQLAAIEALAPGRSGQEVDNVARQVLAEHDLDTYFGHGLGHSLGLAVHDPVVRLGQTSECILEAGNVLTVEPGVYIEGFGGCRIEDDVVVREEGPEVLTKSPKELLVL
jgi:Xaa-Pro aminopeptidase